MLVLGIDPGVRSGIALVYYGDTDATGWKPWLDYRADVPDSVDGFLEFMVANEFSVRHADVWVIESFVPREGKHGVSDDASRVIGAALALAHVWGVKTVLRAPGGRTRQVPDRVLHNLFGRDAFVGNKDRNIKEAVRHTVSYAKAQGVKAVLEAFDD